MAFQSCHWLTFVKACVTVRSPPLHHHHGHHHENTETQKNQVTQSQCSGWWQSWMKTYLLHNLLHFDTSRSPPSRRWNPNKIDVNSYANSEWLLATHYLKDSVGEILSGPIVTVALGQRGVTHMPYFALPYESTYSKWLMPFPCKHPVTDKIIGFWTQGASLCLSPGFPSVTLRKIK